MPDYVFTLPDGRKATVRDPQGQYADAVEAFSAVEHLMPAPERNLPSLSEIGTELAKIPDAARSLLHGNDPGTGPDYGREASLPTFQMELGARDTEQEIGTFLDGRVGKDNWYRDSEGTPILRPAAQEALGLPPSDRDIPANNRSFIPSGADVWNFVGQGGAPMVGGAIGGALGVPLGPLGSAGGAMLGAGLGRWGQETWEQFTGRNQQGSAGVAGDIATEMAFNAFPAESGKAVTSAVGRKLSAPFASQMEEADRLALNEARRMGVNPLFSQAVPDTGLLGRAVAVANRVFTRSSRKLENIRNLDREAQKLLADLPVQRSNTEYGEIISRALRGSNEDFSAWSRELYAPLKAAVGGTDVPVVPTQRIRDVARAELDRVATTLNAAGEEVPMALDGMTQRLQTYANMPEAQTLDQVWSLRDYLRGIRENPSMNPGITDAVIARLDRAAGDALTDIPEYGGLARDAASRYGRAIQARQDAMFDRLLRNPGEAGSFDPGEVVTRLFKPHAATRINKLMREMPEAARSEVRRAGFARLFEQAGGGPSGDIAGVIAQAGNPTKGLAAILRGYDHETLVAMLGPESTAQLKRLSRVMSLNARKFNDYGGLVAAALATHPLKHAGRIAKLRGLKELADSPTGLRWFTEGLDFRSPAGQRTKALAKAFEHLGWYTAAGAGEGMEEQGLTVPQ